MTADTVTADTVRADTVRARLSKTERGEAMRHCQSDTARQAPVALALGPASPKSSTPLAAGPFWLVYALRSAATFRQLQSDYCYSCF